MRNLIRGVALLLIGAVVGSVATQRGLAQGSDLGVRLGMVEMSVKNLDESLSFYTQKMGFREAGRLNNPDGKPRVVWLHVSRDTFLGLFPASANRPTGVPLPLFATDDMRASVMKLRQAGVEVDDRGVNALTNTPLAFLKDPDGLTLELFQPIPGSLFRKAADSWKPQ